MTPGMAALRGILAALTFGIAAQITPAAAQSTASDGVPTADRIVVVVDEKPITLGELIVMRQRLPQAYQDLPDEVLLDSLVKLAVRQQVLANAAEAAGLQSGPALRYALRNHRRKALADAFVADRLKKGLSEDAINAAFQERYLDVKPVEQVRAAHILVAEKATADDIWARLQEGADFATLAARHGTDLTANRGGDLGWQDVQDLFPAFAAALAEMQVGEVKGPVNSPFGWHIIKLDQRRAKPQPLLEDVRQQLLEDLEEDIRATAIDEAVVGASITTRLDDLPAAAVRDDSLLGE